MENTFWDVISISGAKYIRSGSGTAMVVLQGGSQPELLPVYRLLAKTFEVTIVATALAAAANLAKLLVDLAGEKFALVCDESTAAAGIDYARAHADLVTSLVLVDPQLVPRPDYAEVTITVLVLESSLAPLGRSGQQLASTLPRCYHILIYDAPVSTPLDRAEAAAEVIGDFVERGPAFVLRKPQGALHP